MFNIFPKLGKFEVPSDAYLVEEGDRGIIQYANGNEVLCTATEVRRVLLPSGEIDRFFMIVTVGSGATHEFYFD